MHRPTKTQVDRPVAREARRIAAPVEKYKRNTTDDDLVVEGVNGIRSGKWPNSLQAAEALAGRAKGSSHDSKVTRLRKKIGAALED